MGCGKRCIIQAEDFCEFCRKHTRDVVGNRLTKERLDFVYHFAFPPCHAELLPVRDAQKEERAYEEQLEQERQENSPRFQPKGVGDGDDAFEQSA